MHVCLHAYSLALHKTLEYTAQMLNYPQISPDAFSIGSFSVRWYGLMYLLAFLIAWYLGKKRAKTTGFITPQQFEDMLTLGIIGVLLGGRLGYVLFYDLPFYIKNPDAILYIWQGGMSFHGGLLGVLVAMWYSANRYHKSFFAFTDFIAPLVPQGLFWGRIGNFINAELWGKPTSVAWGMVFPHAGATPRHPSQLYEAALEGALLFAVLWAYSAKPRPTMAVSGLFSLGYGVARFSVEFFREPDAHIGYLFGGFFTMGMLLCVPLILFGAWLMWRAYHPAAAPPPKGTHRK